MGSRKRNEILELTLLILGIWLTVGVGIALTHIVYILLS